MGFKPLSDEMTQYLFTVIKQYHYIIRCNDVYNDMYYSTSGVSARATAIFENLTQVLYVSHIIISLHTLLYPRPFTINVTLV